MIARMQTKPPPSGHVNGALPKSDLVRLLKNRLAHAHVFRQRAGTHE